MEKLPIIIFLMGPTAIGKTKLAIKLKKKNSNIELLSVDSKLVYKGLDIGTSKPTKKELYDAPHGLLDIIDPEDIYSAAKFRIDALSLIKDIISIGKVPVLVGGSIFYFHVLLNGLTSLPPSNPDVRKYIFSDLCKNSNLILLNFLKKIDADSLKKIHFNDTQRIIRAIEVFFVSGGKKLSEFLSVNNEYKFPYTVFSFGLIPVNKEKLFNKITKRFKSMLRQGFEKEVKKLYFSSNLNFSNPAINSIGYKQMYLYFQKKYTYQEMITETIRSTRKLVKRQLTWINNWKNIILFKDDQKEMLIKKINNIITK